MQVSGLATVAIDGLGRGEPTAVLAITQWATQGRDAVRHQLGITGQAHGVGHGKAVGHAGGVHGFGAGIGRQLALIVEVAKTVRQARGFGECQQALPFGGEPAVMGRCVQPTTGRQWLHGHG